MYPDLRLCHRNEQKLESGLAAGAHIADEITATGAEDKKYSDAELTQAALAAISRDAPMAAGKVRSVVRNGWLILGRGQGTGTQAGRRKRR